MGGTHIDEVLPVADEQVAQNARLVEIPQADHVLHSMHRGGVHRLNVRGILRGNPMLLQATESFISAAAPDLGCAEGWEPRVWDTTLLASDWFESGDFIGLYPPRQLSSS